MDRKKRLRIIQLGLIAISLLIFFFTYLKDYDEEKSRAVVSKNVKDKIEKKIKTNNNDANIFYNIQYSGLDVSGNRYIIKSEEAITNDSTKEIIIMNNVEAFFYFKDNTILYVDSKKAEYNNKTLDIKFLSDVVAKYDESKLFAEEAEYSNSNNKIIIENNVRINDKKGNLFADKLIFDIKNQNLNITSLKDSTINANIDLNEKKF